MQPKTADSDPFDLSFEADDEFDTENRATTDAWRETPLDLDDGPGTPAADPFAGLPKAEPADDPFEGLKRGEPLTDPFAGLPKASPAADPFEGLKVAEPVADPFDEAPRGESVADPFEDLAQPAAVAADPFAGLPKEGDPADPFADLPRAEATVTPDPFADLPPRQPRAVITHPDDEGPVTGDPEAAPAVAAVSDFIVNTGAAQGDLMVPRITIHAFCVTEPVMELVNTASRDRRMERATTVVRPGGLDAAVECYQTQPTPSLLILETVDAPATLFAQLERLAEVCDPGTKVIMVGAANDIALYRELMRRGVSEYLVPPLKTLQLVSAVTTLYADPEAPFIGRQMAFCSARGGAGSSTLAHNLAHEIAKRMQAGTVIVDLDLAFGTAGLNFNHDPLQGIVDALSQPDRLDPVLMDRMMTRPSDHLSLFAAPATLEQDYDIPAEVFEEVIQKIRASAPYVVLDLPHAWTTWKRRMLVTSDDLVIVAEPDLASLRNTKNILDLVRAARPNDAPPKVVLNKVAMPGRPEIPLKDFGEAVGVVPVLAIPFDAKSFGQAANNGQMITDVAAKTKSAESIEQLFALMLNQREPVAAPAKTSILSSLFKRK